MALPAALLLLTGVAAAAIGRRPNVITILTDDQVRFPAPFVAAVCMRQWMFWSLLHSAIVLTQ
jgi:hypothetical protein